MRPIVLAVVLIATTGLSIADAGSPTGWSPVVLPTGDYREHIKSMPIESRPGRLLHVYGNTIRLIDNVNHGRQVRPLRQIFLGTPQLRSERIESRDITGRILR